MDSPQEGWVSKIEGFMSGWKFPVFSISLLFFFILYLLFILFVPDTGTKFSAFAKDFKIWCFGYNPETGTWQWAYFVMFFSGPLALIVILFAVWMEPLKEIVKTSPRRLIPYIGFTLTLALLLGGIFPMIHEEIPQPKNLPFPADSLRTSIPSTPFTLINQEGKEVSLQSLQGRVVMITAVYATCNFT